jgi:hypothetical protein
MKAEAVAANAKIQSLQATNFLQKKRICDLQTELAATLELKTKSLKDSTMQLQKELDDENKPAL